MEIQYRSYKSTLFSTFANVRVLERSNIEKYSFQRTKILALLNFLILIFCLIAFAFDNIRIFALI